MLFITEPSLQLSCFFFFFKNWDWVSLLVMIDCHSLLSADKTGVDTRVVVLILHFFLFEMACHTIAQMGLEFVNLLPQPRLRDVGLDVSVV